MVILVPDGYTQATAAGTAVPVANNAAFLSRIGDGTVVFTGPGEPDRIIRLDPSFVSAYQGDLADTQEDNARIALTGLAQAARVYRDAHGTTDGFAAQFRAQEGDALFNQMKQCSPTPGPPPRSTTAAACPSRSPTGRSPRHPADPRPGRRSTAPGAERPCRRQRARSSVDLELAV